MRTAAVKPVDTRGGQSRVMSSCTSLMGGSGDVGLSGGTAYVVAGATAMPGGSSDRDRDPARQGSELDRVPVKLYSSGVGRHVVGPATGHQNVSDVGWWNQRGSMAFDSAKGLLNPVGENNCFLNSAVQVHRQSSIHQSSSSMISQ